MSFSELADNAAKSITEILEASPSEDQAKNSTQAIEEAIIKAVLDERSRCATVARDVCSPDQDMAHKISAEIKRANAALIANLSSMR